MAEKLRNALREFALQKMRELEAERKSSSPSNDDTTKKSPTVKINRDSNKLMRSISQKSKESSSKDAFSSDYPSKSEAKSTSKGQTNVSMKEKINIKKDSKCTLPTASYVPDEGKSLEEEETRKIPSKRYAPDSSDETLSKKAKPSQEDKSNLNEKDGIRTLTKNEPEQSGFKTPSAFRKEKKDLSSGVPETEKVNVPSEKSEKKGIQIRIQTKQLELPKELEIPSKDESDSESSSNSGSDDSEDENQAADGLPWRTILEDGELTPSSDSEEEKKGELLDDGQGPGQTNVDNLENVEEEESKSKESLKMKKRREKKEKSAKHKHKAKHKKEKHQNRMKKKKKSKHKTVKDKGKDSEKKIKKDKKTSDGKGKGETKEKKLKKEPGESEEDYRKDKAKRRHDGDGTEEKEQQKLDRKDHRSSSKKKSHEVNVEKIQEKGIKDEAKERKASREERCDKRISKEHAKKDRSETVKEDRDRGRIKEKNRSRSTNRARSQELDGVKEIVQDKSPEIEQKKSSQERHRELYRDEERKESRHSRKEERDERQEKCRSSHSGSDRRKTDKESKSREDRDESSKRHKKDDRHRFSSAKNSDEEFEEKGESRSISMEEKSSWQNKTIRITISNESTADEQTGFEQKLRDKYEGNDRSESKYSERKEKDEKRSKKEKTRGHEGHHSKEKVKVKIEHLEKDFPSLEEYFLESKKDKNQKAKVDDVFTSSKDSGKVSNRKSSAENCSLHVVMASDNHKPEITDNNGTGQDGTLRKEEKVAKVDVAKMKDDKVDAVRVKDDKKPGQKALVEIVQDEVPMEIAEKTFMDGIGKISKELELGEIADSATDSDTPNINGEQVVTKTVEQKSVSQVKVRTVPSAKEKTTAEAPQSDNDSKSEEKYEITNTKEKGKRFPSASKETNEPDGDNIKQSQTSSSKDIQTTVAGCLAASEEKQENLKDEKSTEKEDSKPHGETKGNAGNEEKKEDAKPDGEKKEKKLKENREKESNEEKDKKSKEGSEKSDGKKEKKRRQERKSDAGKKDKDKEAEKKEECAIDSEIEEGEIIKKHKKSKKKDKKKEKRERSVERDRDGKHKRQYSESRSHSRSHKKHKRLHSRSRSHSSSDESDINIQKRSMVEKTFFSESRGCWMTTMVPKEESDDSSVDDDRRRRGGGNDLYDISDTYIRHSARDRGSVFDRLGGDRFSQRDRYDRSSRYGYRRRRSYSRSRSRSRSPKLDIDKKKLLEIAKANALMKMRAGELPANLPIPESIKRAADTFEVNETIQKFTNQCKAIANTQNRSSDEDSPVNRPVGSDDEEEGEISAPFVRHPFKVKEAAPIILNIRDAVQIPVQQSKDKLRVQFPVSSGSQHRKKEEEVSTTTVNDPYGQWTAVEKPEPKPKPVPPTATKATTPATASTAAATTAEATPATTTTPATAATAGDAGPTMTTPHIPGVTNVEPPKPVAEEDKVFEDAPGFSYDISQIVSARLKAARALQSNPNNVEALTVLHHSQKQIQTWAHCSKKPGLFTGSTDAKFLRPEQLGNPNPKHQAWTRKDMFLTAAPVGTGIGQALMQKMGWRQGEGLGKNKEGSINPLLLEIKTDRQGLVAAEEKPKKKGDVSKVIRKDLSGKHPVMALNELCNKRRWGKPSFEMVRDDGPPHKKNFVFKVRIRNEEYIPTVPSGNKKDAKAMAATVALQKMGLLPS